MHSPIMFTPASCSRSSELDLTVCKWQQVPPAEALMISYSAHSNSLNSGGGHATIMASASEQSERSCVAGENTAMCRSCVSSVMTVSNVISTPESEDYTQSLSGVPTTDLNPLQSEIDVSQTTDGTACDTDIPRVSINDLPDEILVKIFADMSFSELVDVVQKVCSRWSWVSRDAELWVGKMLEVRSWDGDNSDTCKGVKTDQEVMQTLCNAPNLSVIHLRRGAKSQVFRTLYTRCHRLNELHVHYSQKLSYSVLKNIAEKCSEIHTLRISSELLKSKALAEAVSRFQHLRAVVLDEHSLERPVQLRPLANGCPQLSDVDFGYLNLDIEDLRYFLNAKKNTLKSIHIKWTMDGRRCVLPLLTVCADSLEYLHLYEFDLVRDEAVEAFTALGSLKNLQELWMSITDVPPAGTAPLAFKSGGLSKMTLLDLRDGVGLDDDTVIAICHGCPLLIELSVRGAELLSDTAFSQIHCLKQLEVLDISGCNGLGGTVIPFFTRLPLLHTLLMREMEFSKMAPGLSNILDLSGLNYLILDYSSVTGVPFDRFPGKLINLRELHIELCRGDSKIVDVLSERMPDLHIYGTILEEQPPDYSEHESDADTADDEVDAAHGLTWEDHSDSEEDIWSECDCDVPVLFLLGEQMPDL